MTRKRVFTTNCKVIIICRVWNSPNSLRLKLVFGGAGLRWRPLPQAEAPTEPTGETATFEIYQTSPPNLIYKPVDKLTAYLADIDEQAEEMFFRLVKRLAEKEGVTEQLKAENQMLWGAGLRWRPLPQAEAPTEPTGETAYEQYP